VASFYLLQLASATAVFRRDIIRQHRPRSCYTFFHVNILLVVFLLDVKMALMTHSLPDNDFGARIG